MTLTILMTALLLTAGAEPLAQLPPPPPGSPPPAAAQATKPVAATLPAAPMKDPAALALVKKMSDRLQGARTFTFLARTVMEAPVPGGVLATFVNNASVAVRRPDGLAAKRRGGLPEFNLAYDGKAMTVYTPAHRSWATAAAPPTLDAMIVAAAEQADINLPFDELLVADPYAAITRDAVLALHVASVMIDGKKVDHVLIGGRGLQLEYWIDATTSLPTRANVVYTDDPLRPHFAVDFSDWKLDQKLPASTFALPKPTGARQVDIREASSDYR